MSDPRNLNDVTANWKELKGVNLHKLPMNIGPITNKAYNQSQSKLARIGLKKDDSPAFKDQYQRIKKQLKIAGRRRLVYSKFAIFGILIVIVLAALRYYEAGKDINRYSVYTKQQIQKRFDQQKNFLQQQIEKYTAQIESGKEGITRRNRKLRKDPEKLEKYWQLIHKVVENDKQELARLKKLKAEDFFDELTKNARTHRTEKFWELLGYILVIPLYLFSRATPNYLLWQQRGYSRSWQKILNFIEYIATGSFLIPLIGMSYDDDKDYVVKRTWSDGSTTLEAPETGGFFRLLLILFLISVIVALLPVRIVMGVLRNWVLYV